MNIVTNFFKYNGHFLSVKRPNNAECLTLNRKGLKVTKKSINGNYAFKSVLKDNQPLHSIEINTKEI